MEVRVEIMTGKFLEDWKRRQKIENQKASNEEFLADSSRIIAELSARSMRENYHAIRHQVSGLALLPMVKANAYGHGAIWASRLLLELPDLYGLGVATLQEGVELRQGLGQARQRAKILIFSGCTGWTEEKGRFCEAHGLTPVIATEEDWNRFLRGGWPERLSYELKFNTGMNRLGIPMALARRMALTFEKMPSDSHPQGIFSHLALGESPDSSLSRHQRDQFVALRREFASVAPSARFHLGNSAAIWKEKHWNLRELTDVVRPGLSLYGIPPWAGAPVRGLTPVMTLKASVLLIHRLKAGESVGYGGRFKVGVHPVSVAIIGAGYADGIHRSLGGTETGPGGYVWLGGREHRVLGTISMDMCSVSCSNDTKPGDWVEFLGPRVDPWAQAQISGTIPYELLTSVSGRVQRVYGET